MGHLIDSATNNHHRFVRAQFESIPRIVYDQNNWNRYSYYQQLDGQQLIEFWAVYNRHLLQLVQWMPDEQRAKRCDTGGEFPHALAFLLEDYVAHLEHHLGQIFGA